MKRIILSVSISCALWILGACSSETRPPAATPTPVVSPTTAPSASPAASPSGSPAASPATSPGASKTDAMAGKWPGVDGGSLDVTKKDDKYVVVIAGRGGSKTFEGTAKGDGIEFTRNGKTETLKHSTGDETGVKGFAGKKDCLVVTRGIEAFCKN